MPHYTLFGDIVEANGKTIRQNNLDRLHHDIPLDTLVEVRYDHWHGGGACEKIHARLWVVAHGRDCDGTPLYSLAPKPTRDHLPGKTPLLHRVLNDIRHGFGRESLTPVEVTEAVRRGEGLLEWGESVP